MAVLVCLAKCAPGVVSKDRLLTEVWEGAFVGEDAIAHAIWELRKGLGDSARRPDYIQTVPRKGYRLIAEVLRPQGAPLPVEGVRIDHFDLGGELGRGSMGVVFRAVDRRLDRTVAIKFLAAELTQDTKACRRFEREARLAASLEHPNLATVHEVGETSQGYRYLVSSFYRGGSLKERLAEGPLPNYEAVRLVRQLVSGLGAAHRREIIHRDIKPANLLLDAHGTLKISDFGIAKLVGATDLTSTGATLGTPAYKSPEQAAGRAVDHRTDLWAAGVVLYELLTGKRPFQGDGEHAVVHSILSKDPELPAIPSALRRFMEKALSKDPEKRYQSADEMIAGLDAAVADDGTSVSPRPRFTFRQAILAGAVSVLLVAGIWWATQERGPAEPLPPSASVSNPQGERLLNKAKELWLRGHYTHREVERHLRAAVDLMPASAEAKGHLAFFLAEQFAMTNSEKTRKDSLKLISETRALDPSSALAQAAEARVLLISRDLSGTGENLREAEQLARAAVEGESSCAPGGSCDLAYQVLAEVLYVQEKSDEALSTLRTGLKYGEGAIRCNLKLAQLYEKLKDPWRMEQAYREVLDLDPDQTVALTGIAHYYQQSSRFDEADDLLKRLHRVSQDPRVLLYIGYGQYRNKLWPEALETFKRADSLLQEADGIRYPNPLMGIGDVYLEQDDTRQAQESYLQALEIFDQQEKPTLLGRAQHAVCLAKLGRFGEAIPVIESLLGDPKNNGIDDLWVYAARIYAVQGNDEKLFAAAREWSRREGLPDRLLHEDPAFISYRDTREYLPVVRPGLIPPQ